MIRNGLWAAALCLAWPCAAAAGIKADVDRDSVSIDFDTAMATWENKPIPVRAEPALPLKCRWDDDTRIACDIVGKTVHSRLATAYRIHLPALKTQAGATLPPAVLDVETARPELGVSRWNLEWNDGLPQVELDSNQTVTRAAVLAVLDVRINGQAAGFDLAEHKGESTFVLTPRGEVPADAAFEVAVRPGLRGIEGVLPGRQDMVLFRARINPAPQLLGITCAHHAWGWPPTSAVRCPTGTLRLAFSRPVDDASKRRFAAHLPAGVHAGADDWSIDRSYRADDVGKPPRQGVELRIDAPRQHLAIPIEGLVTTGGVAFPSATLRLDTGDIPPVARAPHSSLLLADPSVSPVTVINADKQDRLVVDTLARDRRHSERQLPAGSRNAALPVDDPITTKALRQGGWARWTIASDGGDGALQVAAPAFDVTTLSAQDDVLVWVNDWSDQAPVAAAQVELLLKRSDEATAVMATGATAGDGVALLHVPAGFVLDKAARRSSTWFVRVHSDGGRGKKLAVIPLGNSESWSGLHLGQEDDGRSWGVTDRPIYHPGDRVRFRLWWRNDHAGRLQHATPPADSRLRLYDVDENRTLVSWPQHALADGWSGDVAIPVHATDGHYCVSSDQDTEEYHGACFQVGTYRAQDLWVEAAMQDRVVHRGDRVAVDVHGGYYSGGPAVNVDVRHVSTMLTGWPLEEAYPQYAGYTFVDVRGEEASEGIPLAIPQRALRTDRMGQARLDLPVAFKPRGEALVLPAFGRLQVTAELGLSAREGTTSNAVSTRFATADRFVGLRLSPRWLDARSPVQADAVVIDANGHALTGQPVDIRIEYRAGWREQDDDAPTMVGTCRLQSGSAGDCTFPRAHSGRYRLVARSGDAAPAILEQYVWASDNASVRTPDPVLEVDGDVTAAGESVSLALRQAPAGWPALFVASQHGRVIGHLRATTTSAGTYALPLVDAHAGTVDVAVYLRDPNGGAADGAFRKPVAIRKASTTFSVPQRPQTAITLQAQPVATAPGQRVLVTVHNTTGSARHVTASVMDDALRALAAGNSEFWDPRSIMWLGDEESAWHRELALRSFASWNDAAWSLSLGPAEDEIASDDAPAEASAGVAAPAKMAESYAANSANRANALDKVVVTGSRIALSDIFGGGKGRQDAPARHVGAGAEGLLSRLARVRGDFADTAFWLGDMVLQPGESRTLEVTLPDNLTRWRAVAWSSDADDDFQIAETTVEAGLPVEARLQAPVRLYPGDQARLQGNVRQQAGAAARAQVLLEANGGGIAADYTGTRPLAAGGQAAFALSIAPTAVGTVAIVAAAGTPSGSDGVGAHVDVASPLIEARKVQVGWLGADGVALDVPSLPPGASSPLLDIEVQRGAAGLLEHWTRTLRDYPHRCWEQILSRAIGAALALARHDETWPVEDAKAAVAEAVTNAAVFQDDSGSFQYFPYRFEPSRGEPDAQYALTAYSVRGLELLARLGHPVDESVLDDARSLLKTRGQAKVDDKAPDEIAFASAIVSPQAIAHDRLWRDFGTLSIPARIAFAQSLAQSADPHAAEAIDRLLELAPLRGERRVLGDLHEWPRWMATPLSEQCSLIALLDGQADRREPRRQLIAGLTDLYAGGLDTTDTQAAALCLMALQESAGDKTRPVAADVEAGPQHARVTIAPGDDRAGWQTSATGITRLRITTDAAGDVPTSYSTELRYQEDARRAQPSAVGFALERRYEALRGGKWVSIARVPLREGDWVRITLTLSNSTARHFVAVSDEVPGGLQPTDLSLAGVAGLDLKKVSDTGSWWFDTRRLDPRTPRFYAQYLPAGQHVLHYFARVGNAGDYLAAPATAELMYGTASRARTAAQRIAIKP